MIERKVDREAITRLLENANGASYCFKQLAALESRGSETNRNYNNASVMIDILCEIIRQLAESHP
jgi:hypothetical protein